MVLFLRYFWSFLEFLRRGVLCNPALIKYIRLLIAVFVEFWEDGFKRINLIFFWQKIFLEIFIACNKEASKAESFFEK